MVYIILLAIVTVSFLFIFQILRKEKQMKINNFFKTFDQLNSSLKIATQTLYDILSVVENEVQTGISERVNLLERQIDTLSNCIYQLSIIKENCLLPEMRETCVHTMALLQHAVKKTTIQLFNMGFIAHDFRDYFLKVTEYRLKLIKLEKEFTGSQ
ncbi:hypothetical protein ACIQAA_27070 [Neobacillus sp. NPDC093182]|uniref:hypothetical protein n=1 Tax=Neobacillus sp. NPDC093182 TaxID=3364297 RepID=UPI0038301965